MPYKFPSLLVGLTRKHIDEAGTQLLTPALTMYGTLGAFVEFAVGVTATGNGPDLNPETVFDRTFSFRWKLYAQQGSANPAPSANGFRFKTGGAIAAAAPMEFFASNGALLEPNQNYSATLEVVSSTQIIVRFRFYFTSEDPNYAPFFINNLNRLLASKNTGNHMELEPGSQMAIGATGVSIVMVVSDAPPTEPPSPTFTTVTRDSGAKEYWTPVQMKWPGRNVGNTDYAMYLSEFDVKTLNGDVLASKTHKDTALPHQARYDDNFVSTASGLSYFEDNIFRFRFLAGSIVSFTATAVRVILVRTDNVDNDQQFLIAYSSSIANIPASDTTQDNISGDIYAPASFVNGSGYWEVKFRVPGTALKFGATYRAICVMYGTTFAEVYSGISHEMIADATPNIYPEADIFFADYFKESVLPKGIAAYHSAYRARIEVVKKSVADAFTYYGLTGDFDTNAQYVTGSVVKPGTENTDGIAPQNAVEKFRWTRGGGLVAGQDYVNTVDYLLGAFTGFIDEEWLPYADQVEADYYVTVQWEIGISFPLGVAGQTVLLQCRYQQEIVARRWESEVGQPTPPSFVLDMSLFKGDGITAIMPGTQTICGTDEILAIVEKSGILSGGSLDAYCIPETYAESNTDGDTVDGAIRQRRGVFAGYLPAALNSEINAYDAQFSFNTVAGSTVDDAGIRVDVSDLSATARHWLVALARPINTDESPFIAVNATVAMVRDSSPATTVTADFTAWRAAFDALLTGADTLIDFRIKNAVTQNFAGITAGGSGNPSGNSDVCEVIIDHKKSPCAVVEVVYEIEGTISGHLVRFMYRGQLDLPTAPGTITATVTPSLWKIMDYDY